MQATQPATATAQYQTQLAQCEFFLRVNNEGQAYANLRIPPAVLEESPLFINHIFESLKGANCQVTYFKVQHHGWMGIQFKSGYTHYLSLNKRCLESNLQINRRLTKEILTALEKLNQSTPSSPCTSLVPVAPTPLPVIIPEIVGDEEEIDWDTDWEQLVSTPLPLPVYSNGTTATKKQILATVEKGKGYSRLRKGELIESINSGRIGLK
jgi:hypothetical protein